MSETGNTRPEKTVALVILDGWGLSDSPQDNAVHLARTPAVDAAFANSPYTQLLAHGENVGLPPGQMGNSEVGHTNIGAGRVVEMDLPRLNRVFGATDCAETPEIRNFIREVSGGRSWEPPVRQYVDDCMAGQQGPRQKNFNMRWVASMVAEVHRILLRGGIFLYPIDEANRSDGGKLRLFYEANPMAMLIEQAGGSASTRRKRILEVAPTAPHQRVPVILGSREEVVLLESMHREFDEAVR